MLWSINNMAMSIMVVGDGVGVGWCGLVWKLLSYRASNAINWVDLILLLGFDNSENCTLCWIFKHRSLNVPHKDF